MAGGVELAQMLGYLPPGASVTQLRYRTARLPGNLRNDYSPRMIVGK
jgi:hypothetical protein